MSIAAYLKPENGPLGRAFGAWLDHAPTGLASRFVLLWFVILYTAFAIISSASVGLHPVWLMFALVAFGSLFGFVGLLLAVPLAASLGVLARFALARYMASPLYTGEGRAALAPPEAPLPSEPPPADRVRAEFVE